MDYSSISTAVVLFALLIAWYALLEYREWRQRGGAGPSPHAPETGERGAAGRVRRRQGAGAYVTQQDWRSNGSPRPWGQSAPAGGGRRLVFRGSAAGYGLAFVSVLLAHVLVTLVNLLFSFPPLIFFAASVAVTLTLAGRAPGLLALILATLLTDFFFINPTFVFSLDWQVFRVSLLYLSGGLLSLFISQRLSSSAPAN